MISVEEWIMGTMPPPPLHPNTTQLRACASLAKSKHNIKMENPQIGKNAT